MEAILPSAAGTADSSADRGWDPRRLRAQEQIPVRKVKEVRGARGGAPRHKRISRDQRGTGSGYGPSADEEHGWNRHRAYLATSIAVARAVAEERALDELLQRSTDALVDGFRADMAQIWLVGRDGGRLELLSSAAGSSLEMPVPEMERIRGLVATTAVEGVPQILDSRYIDMAGHGAGSTDRGGERAWLTYPMIVEGRLNGVLVMLLSQSVDVDIENALSGIACQIAAGVERKRAQASLLRDEDHLRALFLAAEHVALVISDVGKPCPRIVEFSVGAEKIFGYRREEIIGEPVSVLHLEEDLAAFPDYLRSLKNGKPGPSRELTMVRKSGEHFPVLFSCYPVLDDQGRMYAILGVSIDISEQKATERALRLSEATLNSVFRSAPTGIGLVVDRVLTWTNDRLSEITGYSAAELSGESARILYPTQEEFERVGKERFRQVRERGSGTVETRWRCKDGQIIDVLLSSTPIDPDDWDKGVTFTALDISDRKAVERALRESEQRLRWVMERSPGVFWAIDRDGIVTFSEGKGLEMLGLQPGEIVGASLFELYRHQPQILVDCRRALAGESILSRIVERGRVFDTQIAPLRNDRDEVEGVLGVGIDVTEWVQLEERLRQSQKMQAVGQLAGGVAHDFNNLLQAIQGYVEFCLLAPGDFARVRDNLQLVLQAVERGADLIRQLLAFSRHQELQLHPIRLDAVVDGLAPLLRRVIGEHVALDLYSGADVLPIEGDPGQIEQVLMNLCVNARDAMPGGGTIRIRTEMTRAAVETGVHFPEGTGALVRLEVADSGVGMEPATRERVFEPFFTTKEFGEGTGLGLATVYAIVERHRGTIDVFSEIGRGTRFRLYFPVAEREPEVKTEVEEEVPPPRGSGLILLAEDDELVRSLAVRILEHAGYRVLVCRNGEEALERFAQHADEVDLALLDVVMPKLGGREVLHELRKRRPQLPVIFCSGYRFDEMEGTLELGEGIDFLRKPYRSDTLLKHIQAALKH